MTLGLFNLTETGQAGRKYGPVWRQPVDIRLRTRPRANNGRGFSEGPRDLDLADGRSGRRARSIDDGISSLKCTSSGRDIVDDTMAKVCVHIELCGRRCGGMRLMIASHGTSLA